MMIGYVRVSTDKQHPENQMDEIRRCLAANGQAVDRWVTEVISGKKEIRGRKLGILLKRMKKGDTVIVTEISRLSRSLTEIMSIMGLCVEKGINIYTIKEKYKFDDSINSKVLCFAFGLVAEIERNLISMRTKEALAARKAEGKVLGRHKGNCPKVELLHRNKEKIKRSLADGISHKEIYSSLGVSKGTYFKFMKNEVVL